jgi:hypothetical protein
LIVNRRVQIGFFPWRFVDGESCIGRCVAILEDKEYAGLLKRKAGMQKTKFGDAFNPTHVETIEKLSQANLKQE